MARFITIIIIHYFLSLILLFTLFLESFYKLLLYKIEFY